MTAMLDSVTSQIPGRKCGDVDEKKHLKVIQDHFQSIDAGVQNFCQ